MHELTLAELEAAEQAGDLADAAFHMDEDRFRSFYDRTSRPLWSYLAHVSGNPSLADDLLQETYYRFLRARLAEENEAYLRNYLFRIATNLTNDHWRDGRNQKGALDRDLAEMPSADDTPERLQQQSDLDRALSRLKPRERQMLWLAYVMGSSHKEIAEALGLKAQSVRLLLFRSRRKLAALLGRANARKDFTTDDTEHAGHGTE